MSSTHSWKLVGKIVWSAAYSTFVHSLLSRVTTGDFGGLSPPNKTPSPPDWNISGVFVNFGNIKPHRTNAMPPYWKLSSDGSESADDSSFVYKKPNLTQMKQEFKYLREQWQRPPKILGVSKCLLLGEQQYFVWDTAS